MWGEMLLRLGESFSFHWTGITLCVWTPRGAKTPEGNLVGGRELAGATGQAAGWKGRETEAPGVGNVVSLVMILNHSLLPLNL